MIWKFNLANSVDLVDIAELSQARGRSLNTILNRAGSCGFNYPMTAEFAELINPWSSAIKAYRWNWRATQALRAGGTIGNVWDLEWTGYVATIDEDISGDRMTVNAVGWLQRMFNRILRQDKNYPYVTGNSWDDADIIFDLLAEANGSALEYAPGTNNAVLPADGYRIYWPAGSTPNTPTWIKQGSKLPQEGVGGATAYTPAYRGKTYTKYQNIGQAMQELTEIENGCDIYVDPATRQLNVFRRQRTIRDDVVFGYNWGPKNIQQLGRQVDGTTQVNYELAVGRPGTIPKYQDDTSAMQTYAPLEEMTNIDTADIMLAANGNPIGQSILQTYAAAEVALRAQPRQIFSLTPFGYTPGGNVPEPFVDYKVGDQIRFSAKWGKRINVQNQACRVFGLNVSIDDNGNEKLGQLQFTPGS